MLLGDLGADVVKLEPPAGDESRTWGPPFWGDPQAGLSAYYAAVNRNKRGIAVDLRTDAGRDVLDRLAHGSQLLVHNFRPGTAGRLGLGAERLAARHPHLVVASVGGFPGDAAARERPAYDLLAQAVSGLMSVTGEPDGTPTKVGVAVLDLLAGLELALGAVAALVPRAAAGRRVEVSLVEAGVTSLVNVLANRLASGDEPRRHGNAHPNIAPYQAFEARDGHLVVAVGNDAQFAALQRTLDLPADARFATNADRLANRLELTAVLTAAIAGRGRDELVAALLARDVPAGPVHSVGEALGTMQDAHGGAWLEEAGEMRLAPSPIRLDGERTAMRLAPPRLGQHSAELLAEAGYEPAQIAALIDSGVVRQA
jgi:crotonobetainyl-CoA:carnitine CoA-transferase CaiB-like acyl-CoA transferase